VERSPALLVSDRHRDEEPGAHRPESTVDPADSEPSRTGPRRATSPGPRSTRSDPAPHAILASMTTSSTTEPVPFSRVKIRVGALVFCGNEVALIRRDRPGSVHYTPPGGNVEPGEDLTAALRRELAEELDLSPHQATAPELLWVVDQRVSRPGPTPPPRKLHLIHRLHVAPEVREVLAVEEYDEQPDGGHEIGVVEWIDHRDTADLPIFPLIGAALAALPSPHAVVADAALPAVTDDDYVWV
jgi:8-oxo-dGTP diphosphatase